MKIETLRKNVGKEEIDYQLLLSALSDYAHPRDKISGWLKSGELIRVKKGLYVFGKEVAQQPYSLETLANLIYGPSAISLNYALSFYGLIPERTITITSITNKRNKLFITPVGEFTYTYLNNKKYSVGIDLLAQSKDHFVLMATPEKALCDFIHLVDKNISLNTINEVEAYLFQDLRLDQTILRTFRINTLLEICKAYQDARLDLVATFIQQWK